MYYSFYLLIALLLVNTGTMFEVLRANGDLFPAEGEFQEVQNILLNEGFEDTNLLVKVQDGVLFKDVGFEKYTRRDYSTINSGSFSIEIVTLTDKRAAFSLLTMIRNSPIQEGPPGDRFVSEGNRIYFAAGKQWVRILGHGVTPDLIKRVALSVSNRMGLQRHTPPSLISRFPQLGYDSTSLRYFVGSRSFDSYSIAASSGFVRFTAEMELAQARYKLQNQMGVLTLSLFPTTQAADSYFSELPSAAVTPSRDTRTYAKRVGPLIAILEGSFDPAVAVQILDPIEYSYSIRWLYEKPKPKTVWGVPVALLGTVVNSLLFVALLCLGSFLAGFAYAVFRFTLRTYAPHNPLDRPDRTEITRLRLK